MRPWLLTLLLLGCSVLLLAGAEAPTDVIGGTATPVAEEPAPAADEPIPEEVLWRQVELEDGRVVVIRDRVGFGAGAELMRDAFMIDNDEVVDHVPLDPTVESVDQLRLLTRVEAVTGLEPARPGRVFAAMAYLSRPTPEPAAPAGLEVEGFWNQIEMSDGKVMVFWDRYTENGDLVRDGFVIERKEVSEHQFLDAAGNAVAQAGLYADADVELGPFEPATEENILIVLHYLDDFIDPEPAVLGGGGDFALQNFVTSTPPQPVVPDTSPETTPPNVSPSGGVGGI